MNAIPHDFKKPVRLSPEWQNRLSGWFQIACGLANRKWAKELPTPIEMSTASVDVAYAQDALVQIPASTCCYRVMIAAGKLPTLLVFPRALILNIIAAMLGDKSAAAEDRELSLVEENLADYFLVHQWLPFFRESWPGAQMVPWELQERDLNPQCSRYFGPADMLLTLPWKIRGPWGESEGQWFFQRKGVLETLGGQSVADLAPLDEKTAAMRKEAMVGALPVTVQVVLGTSELKLSQLSQLQAGDVVLLDQRHDEGIVACAGGRNLFRGRAGRLGSWKAFRIDSIIEK